MSGPRDPGDLPPDLPPEYAEAYRRGYERAFLDEHNDDTEPTQPVPPHEPGPAAPSAAAASGLTSPSEESPLAQPAGLHRSTDPTPVRPSRAAGGRRPLWLVPAILAALAVLLIVSAYGLGRIFSAGVGEVDTGTEQPDGVNLGGASASPDPSPTKKADDQKKKQPGKKNSNQRYAGPVDSVSPGGSNASCRSDSSVDAAGRPVRYPSTNAHDGDLTTAWRCDGRGSGETLQLRLPQRLVIGEVGLVPGYAKTDPSNGADRYAENNRITKVRWKFSNGDTYVQTMSGNKNDRSMRRMRIPRTTATGVVVEIVSSASGPRNTVAISEVFVGAAAN